MFHNNSFKFISQISFANKFVIILHCIFSTSNLFSVKFDKNSFQFMTEVKLMIKICEKFKFVKNSICDKNLNLHSESVISFHFVNLFSETVLLLFFQDLWHSISITVLLRIWFSLLLYLQFFRKQPTRIMFESI